MDDIIIPCGVSLFSEVYDRNKLLSMGKYVVTYEDEWNSIGKGKLLAMNPGTKVPDEWLCSNSFTLFSTEALLSVLLTLYVLLLLLPPKDRLLLPHKYRNRWRLP